LIWSSAPTKTTSVPSSDIACRAASICTVKGLSPPIASTAIAILYPGLLLMIEREEKTAQVAAISMTSIPL